MSERINADHFEEEKAPGKERPRSSSKPPAARSPARVVLSRDEPPPIRLSDGPSTTGQVPGRPAAPNSGAAASGARIDSVVVRRKQRRE
jgi:hypothetical protein